MPSFKVQDSMAPVHVDGWNQVEIFNSKDKCVQGSDGRVYKILSKEERVPPRSEKKCWTMLAVLTCGLALISKKVRQICFKGKETTRFAVTYDLVFNKYKKICEEFLNNNSFTQENIKNLYSALENIQNDGNKIVLLDPRPGTAEKKIANLYLSTHNKEITSCLGILEALIRDCKTDDQFKRVLNSENQQKLRNIAEVIKSL